MPHLTLVRHGQAQTEARDETSYDKLSRLGQQQAKWLGEHLHSTGERFARVYCGTLCRHRETAQAMGAADHAEIVEDARLNEIEYFTLAQLMETQHGLPIPTDREGFMEHLPKVFSTWQAGKITAPPESFEEFESRTRAVIADIAAGQGRALAITSGGFIGMVVRQTMGLDINAMSKVCLAITNTSLHRWQQFGAELALTQFNTQPHLEPQDRQFAQTHL